MPTIRQLAGGEYEMVSIPRWLVSDGPVVHYLGPASPVLDYLLQQKEPVVQEEAQILTESVCDGDWLVSYRYRHLVPLAVLERCAFRAVNLHISYLPWNRGAYPNVWAWYDDTPHGVSLHWMDKWLDTGDLIKKEQVFFEDDDETLFTSYNWLSTVAEKLFIRCWTGIVAGKALHHKQPPGGSRHTVNDFEHLLKPLLTNGWDTPGRVLREAGRIERLKQGEEDAHWHRGAGSTRQYTTTGKGATTGT